MRLLPCLLKESLNLFSFPYTVCKPQCQMERSTFCNNKAASSPGGWFGICSSRGSRHTVTRWDRGSSVLFPSWYKKGSRERGGTCYKAVSLFSASLRQSEVQRVCGRTPGSLVIVTWPALWHRQGARAYVTSVLPRPVPLTQAPVQLAYTSQLYW